VSLRIPTLLLIAIVLTSAGCKSAKAPATPAPVAAPAPPKPAADPVAPPTDPATSGAISGIVHFDGNAPARIPIDVSADPGCLQPDLPNMSNPPNLTEQIVVTDHLLANVYVYVKSGAPSYAAAPNERPVLLNQKGCRYTPHVIAVQQGGSVAFLNSDSTVHNIHTMPNMPGNASTDITEPANSSAPRTQRFLTPENMIPVRCNNHPWMSAFINVAPNPWYAVTNSDGAFSISGLPAGTYTLAAIHEKLGEQDIQITIKPKSVSAASFTFAAK
jgi:plastocyanin